MSDDEKQIDSLSYEALEEALCFLKKKKAYEIMKQQVIIFLSSVVLQCLVIRGKDIAFVRLLPRHLLQALYNFK